jgi:hypothetical protein
MSPQDLHLSLELFRLPVVVGVEEGDQFTPRPLGAKIRRTGSSSIGFANQCDPLAVRGEGSGQIVRAAVIDDQDFVGDPSLRKQAVDGLLIVWAARNAGTMTLTVGSPNVVP